MPRSNDIRTLYHMCTTHSVTNHHDSWPGNHKEQSWSMKYALLTMSDNAAGSLTTVQIQTGTSSVSKHTHRHTDMLCLDHTGRPRYTVCCQRLHNTTSYILKPIFTLISSSSPRTYTVYCTVGK